MATAIRKVEKIRQIVQLKQVMKRWRYLGLKRRSASDSGSDSEDDGGSNGRIPSGYLAVYVGVQRRRFVIPTRYLNLPVFSWLLKKSEEEFGFEASGGLVIPVEVGFFNKVVKALDKDEVRFGRMKLESFLAECCRGEEPHLVGRVYHGFTPLLKARV